ncbi:MAG: hypothetical protein K9N51_04620 [Candidatus Pacebacteria bacterium]|nr:hypothetical protein [Candidatus Paceibacterota bacterium]
MTSERAYEFRRRMDMVHAPNIRLTTASASDRETVIDDSWRITLPDCAAPLTVNVARDLHDYLFTSMRVSVPIERMKTPAEREKTILLTDRTDSPKLGNDLSIPRSYRLKVVDDGISVCGCDARGTAQGAYFLEDLMSLRRAPFLEHQDCRREPAFSPRMSHSGWGLDEFPDSHLNTLAHAGMDAILVFVEDVHRSRRGFLDFNGLIDRAAAYGLDVYFYSLMHSEKHPDDPGADAYYENTYGRLFRECPGAKGLVLVGESCEFPSKDPHTLGEMGSDACYREGIRQMKPRPGWWPCVDFPQWLELIKETVRSHAPEADVVFWTYNWGWAPREERLRLLHAIPTDVSLMVTFEMFDRVQRDNAVCSVMDYSISVPGPGPYFVSEAEIAKKRGIRLYSMSNTGGCTWDFGTTPYEPAPGQWLRRCQALHEAREKYGLSGLMENHHYGFYPSIVSDAVKVMCWRPYPHPDVILRRLAVRDFGESGAADALACWEIWSHAINDLVPSNEDQYGPLRSGPSYPFIFHPDMTRTFDTQDINHAPPPLSAFTNGIIKPFYHPYENEQQSPAPMRCGVELKSLERMLTSWRLGLQKLRSAKLAAPPEKQAAADRMIALGAFIEHTVTTVIHIKKWWRLNMRLLVEETRDGQHNILDELVDLGETEIENARATIPVVETDSRLGWEPTMGYVCRPWHLEWKIRQLRHVIDEEIPAYRKSVNAAT